MSKKSVEGAALLRSVTFRGKDMRPKLTKRIAFSEVRFTGLLSGRRFIPAQDIAIINCHNDHTKVTLQNVPDTDAEVTFNKIDIDKLAKGLKKLLKEGNKRGAGKHGILKL